MDAKQLQTILETVLKQSEARQLALVNPTANHATLASALSARITTFLYDPETGLTFENWFKRFGTLINEDGKDLSDSAKVRLLIGKLGEEEYTKYSNSVAPDIPDAISFTDSVKNLKELFADSRSLFVRRFECLKIKQQPNQDIDSLIGQINVSCETAEMSLTKEDLKCLIFVMALRDESHDIRQKCLQILEDARIKKNSAKEKLTATKASIFFRKNSA
uniref:DUF7083 domain-containing protein n=1 Tax=Meloidogyne incognita TaxID=6306 RepID=A0A914N2S4_MELIC